VIAAFSLVLEGPRSRHFLISRYLVTNESPRNKSSSSILSVSEKRTESEDGSGNCSSQPMLVALLAFLVTSSAWSANEAAPALPIQIGYGEDLDAEFSKQLAGISQQALNFVRRFPPAGYENNLFHWTDDRKILDGKAMHLFFATTKTPLLKPLLQNSGSTNLDAFTMVPIDVKSKSMNIVLVLLVDKIFYDAAGTEHPDGFSRLVVALAHEIYGNVQHFLEFPIESAQKQTRGDRVRQELRAFRASLAFLGELRQNPTFATLPLKMQSDLLARLPFEIDGYRSWLRAHPSEAPDPACEAMLKSLRMPK